MRALIVSYLGDSTIRREAHQEQLDWMFNNGITEIWVNYKGYTDSDFDPRCKYFKRKNLTAPIQPAAARNELLKVWYNTDDDWCIIADNDGILDDRNKGNIIEYLKHNPLRELDFFGPINPATPGAGAFNKLWQDPTLNDYFVFKNMPVKGSFMFLKNLRKHHNFSLLFDEGYATPSAEDYFFGWDLNKLGYNTGWCHNILLKELGQKDQGLWMNNGNRQQYEREWKQAAAREYGFELNGNTLLKNSVLKSWPHKRTITVPKNTTGLFNFS